MIIVKDDWIPKEIQDYLHLAVFGNEEINAMLPLYCKVEPTAYDGENPLPVSFQHVFMSSTSHSEWFGNFSKIPQIVCKKINAELIQILAARLFITVPHKTKLEHYAPHTDRPEPHLGLIYYVNDSDGDTIFFEDPTMENQWKPNIIERVSPKKGRIVLFDGSHLHAGGYPSDTPRCIVNYNLIAER